MCVGFLYTLVVRRPSGSLETAVSRKAILLLFCLHGEADGRLLVQCSDAVRSHPLFHNPGL